jgi:hypothetical protein
MRQEILALKGRMAEIRQQIKEKDLLISGLIIQIRTLADPYAEDSAQIRADELLASAKSLQQTHEELVALSVRYKSLNESLGQ